MLDVLAYKLWYRRFRRPFRVMLRWLLGHQSRKRILLGPLRGCYFIDEGGLSPYSLGIYELHVQYAILNILRKGDVFYDVGANNGFLSLLAAKVVGPEGYVYGFEPLLENAQRALQLMQINNIGNFTLLRQAVSDKQEAAELFLGDSSSTPSLIRGGRCRSITVTTITLDKFAHENRYPNLIKVDVEGAELLVLKGALQLMSGSDAPSWIIEIHSEGNDYAVMDLLTSHGYKIRGLKIHVQRFLSLSYPASEIGV